MQQLLPFAAPIALLGASVAYAISANDPSAFTQGSTLIPAMWACLFGSLAMWSIPPRRGIKAPADEAAPLSSCSAATHYASTLVFALLAPLCLLSAAGGLIAVRDPHGAVWAVLSLAAIIVWVLLPRLLAPASSSQAPESDVSRLTSAVDQQVTAARALLHTYQARTDVEQPAAEGATVAAGEPEAVVLNQLPPAGTDKTAPRRFRARCCACAAVCARWSYLVLATVVLVGFAVQWPLRASEVSRFPPLGRLIPIAVYNTSLPAAAKVPSRSFRTGTGSSGDMTHDLHLLCMGTSTAGRPLIAFEAGGGTSGLSFLALQRRLAVLGWRSCAIDRSGSGSSQPVPIGASTAVDTRRKLAQALIDAGEAGPGPGPTPLILAGHSAGVQIVQAFAVGAANSVLAGSADAVNAVGPAKRFEVRGLALLDGYPDYLRLLRYSDGARDADTTRVCAALQAARAFESVALTRGIMGGSFNPPEEAARYAATYATGYAFYAQFVDYCTSPDGYDSAGSLLQAAASTLGVAPYDPANGVAWPPAPAGAAVIVMPAGGTVGEGADAGNMYWRQAVAYNSTLAAGANATLAVCAGCTHAFPWEQADWAADTMHAFFVSRLGLA